MSLLTPELLRQIEQFLLLAARRVVFVSTSALTPALSPRRGRILRRVLSQRTSSVVHSFCPANNPPAATGLQAQHHDRTSASDSLSSGERARVRAGVTPISNSPKHPTPNIQRRTFNGRPTSLVRRWVLDVECWMFPHPVCAPFPLPGGEGQGEGGRHTNFQFTKTSNTQHPTSDIQWTQSRSRSALGVGCWMLDVPPS
jgi:hypothetical protein